MYIRQCILLLLALGLSDHVQGVAVMSVDLGSEWMKVGIVSPGVPMEIALNKESKRKTPAVISFRDNNRLVGEDAQTVGIRFPKNAYIYLLDLLGKDINHPLVKLYQKRFPQYDIVADEKRGTVLFRHDSNTTYSPEELIAQILGKAKEFAEQGAHQAIKECVLTVPGFFNQAERKALLQAAQLADLKVLQLINDYTAVALNYGIFRSKDFNETAQYIMFYDMGASSTTAALVSYQVIKTKERGYVETRPQLSVIGVGYDRTLGGLEIQIRLRDFLAKKFTAVKKTKSDVYRNPRALAKLFKEAGRVKNVLSANAEHYAQIEGLLDEEDFKVLVTRDDLDGLIQDLYARVKGPIEQALKTAQLTKDILKHVVLVGAGTRMPKIQEILEETVGQPLAKNLNTDEAAAMGAVYKAADLSTGFQVKKFITKDAVIFPIQIVFERTSEQGTKLIKRTLFTLMNPYPQKKIITFNKHNSDFNFWVNYAELEYLPSEEVINVGTTNLTEISLIGVGELIKQNTAENLEPKGLKAHFQMDDSGVLNLVMTELVIEKTVNEIDEEGTLSKLGNTISKLFGGEEHPVTEEPINPAAATDEKDKTETPTVVKNETDDKNDTKPEPVLKSKVVIVKEIVKTEETFLGINVLNEEQLKESAAKISKLDSIEKEINRRATALNGLESFVIDVQTKLSEDSFGSAATDDEKTKITEACNQVSDWLYEDGIDADADTYEKKLDSLKTLTNDVFARVWEHNERPEALNALHSMLNHSLNFLHTAKNLTNTTNPEKDVFSDVEIETLEKMITVTKDWVKTTSEEQDKLKNYETVKLTVRSITDKIGALDREVKYLVNKLKLWRPKKVEKPTVETKEKPVREDKADEDTTSEDGQVEEGESSEPELDDEEVTPTATDETKDSHTEL